MHRVAVETTRTPTARRRPAVPFPAAKLLPPAPSARLVDRPRLHELVERGTTGLVTLVSAHAGSGKTVLLSSWAAEAEPRRVAWLGLDRDDNWSPRFWLGVERALAGTGALDGTSADPGEARLALQIADRLEGREEPVVLVLDDFHEIESPIVQRELQTLIDRSPSGLRLVLSTRVDPGLRLQRLRLTDDLVEIRAAELAFTLDECGEALEPFATDLAEGDVQALCERTEGWAAGIRLAALSLASESDRRRLSAPFRRRRSGGRRLPAERDSRPAARPPARVPAPDLGAGHDQCRARRRVDRPARRRRSARRARGGELPGFRPRRVRGPVPLSRAAARVPPRAAAPHTPTRPRPPSTPQRPLALDGARACAGVS